MFQNIFTATPAEIDAKIATLNGQLAELNAEMARNSRIQHDEHVSAEAFQAAFEKNRELQGKQVVLLGLAQGLDAEFERRGRWNRYYIVNNADGHVHTTTRCQTCFDSTEFCWLVELSGKDAAEVVELAGAQACLSCFPRFRAEIESGRPSKLESPAQKKTREEREAAAAKKAEKAAEAAAKGITDVDGSPLKDDDGFVIKTLRSAQIKAVQALEQAGLDEIYADQTEDDPKHVEHLLKLAKDEHAYAARLIEAIAAKQDRRLEDVAQELAAKASKKLAPALKDEADRKAAGKSARAWYSTRR